MEHSSVIFTPYFPRQLERDHIYLFFFRKGSFRLYLPVGETERKAVSLLPGDILLVSGNISPRPDRLADSRDIDSSQRSRLCVSCPSEDINVFVGPLLLEQNPISRFLVQTIYGNKHMDYLIIRTGDDPRISALLRAIERESENREIFYFLMLNHLFSLLTTHLIRTHSHHCFRDVDAPFSQEGYRIMDEIIRSDFRLTLGDIAKSHHIAPAYASRYVKKTIGASFSELMTLARDHVACLMLSTTPKSIHAIAEQVGYENPENFIRAFKKHHGCTPGEYRQRNSRP